MKKSAIAAAAVTGAAAAGGLGYYWLGAPHRSPKNNIGKKVIVIGIDGMDPRLCYALMEEKDDKGRPLLPNLAKLPIAALVGETSAFAPASPPPTITNVVIAASRSLALPVQPNRNVTGPTAGLRPGGRAARPGAGARPERRCR